MKQLRGSGLKAVFARSLLGLFGWKITVMEPPKKCIIIAAPHTSNWDFIVGILGVWESGIDLKFLSKDSLTKGPLGWWFKSVGAIGVDRTAAHGLIGQVVDEFAKSDNKILAIAPEGTRKYLPYWKGGFYRMAVAAQVPLGFGMFDYKDKTLTCAQFYMPTGDEAVDMAVIAAAYTPRVAAIPANVSEIVLQPK
jgi:1-acyl-sn-glycerol-3-phosphate acyltransferase